MKLKFNTDLSQQEIYATGPELAETMWQDRDKDGNRIYDFPHTREQLVTILDNPVLMTDDYKLFHIKDYIARQTVQLLLRKPMIIIEYDGVRMEFEQGKYPGVWSPNIDTLLMCKAMQKLDYSHIKTAIEVGSWPWFTAKYIASKAPNLEHLVMNDINPNARKYFSDTNKDPRAEFILWDAKWYLDENQFDLVVCNPPYIPRPKAIEDNPYEGLELLIYLIQNLHKEAILNVSSLGEDVINPILETCWAKIELLDEMEVPLKVGNVLNNKERLDYLITEKWLQDNYHDGHQYWQKLKILKLSK